MDTAVCHYSESGDVSAATIDSWHKERGFEPRGSNPLKYIGYHFLIHPDGRVEPGRSTDVQGTHCPGYNTPNVLAICITGSNRDVWYPTPEQYGAEARLIHQFGIARDRIFFHKELYSTDCPGCEDKDLLLACYDGTGQTIEEEEGMNLELLKDSGGNPVKDDNGLFVFGVAARRIQTLMAYARSATDIKAKLYFVPTTGAVIVKDWPLGGWNSRSGNHGIYYALGNFAELPEQFFLEIHVPTTELYGGVF